MIKRYLKKATNSIKTLASKGAFYVLVGNFATKFTVLFGSMVLFRLLTKEQMGILSYMENICAYAYIFAGMGLSNALIRFSILSEEKEMKWAYYKYAVTRGFIFNVIVVAAVIIINMMDPYPEKFAAAKEFIPILILALPFQHLITDNQMNERAMFNNKRFAFISVGSSILVIGLRIVGAITWDIWGVVIGIVAANLVAGLFICLLSYKKYFKGIKAATINKVAKVKANLYAVQYMITNGLWSIFMLMDIFLLGLLLQDPVVIADYKAAYMLPGNMAILSTAIGIFIGPYFVKNEKNHIWVRRNYIKAFLATIALIGIAVILLMIFAKPAIWLISGKEYFNVIPLLRLLLISSFINCGLRFTTANLLSAMGQVKYNMIVSAVGFVTQVLLNIYLIPRYGVMGVAFTSIFVYSIMAISLFIVFNKKYKIIRRKNAI